MVGSERGGVLGKALVGVVVVILALCVVGAFLALHSSSSNSSGLAPRRVTYVVSGTALGANLTYINESGGSEQRDVSLPWSLEMRRREGTPLYLSAQKTYESDRFASVHVGIYADGAPVQQAESEAAFGIATVSGIVP